VSFVKDDHSYTRGVGAVAAMDAVSSKRRRAAAAGARVMARRDAVFARHTLGRINQEAGDGTGTGAGGGVPTKPTIPVRPILTASANRLAQMKNAATLVKDPGAPLATDPIRTLPPPLPVYTPPAPAPTPPKNTGVVPPLVGTSTPWVPPKPPTYTPPDMTIEEIPDVTIETAPEPPPAKKSNSFLLYAAIGAGALYLLTRNK